MNAEEQDRAAAYEAIDAAFATYQDAYVMEADDHLSTLILDALAPVIAGIRREAAAEALKTQAALISRSSNNWRMLAASHGGEGFQAESYRTHSNQAAIDAGRLRDAAQDIIESGWEHTCAATFPATREDPGYGCENPVQHEGDYCARHEPEDDQ
ncbi:hypothetical protein [Pseudarthrobacter sp. S9]|uniref:hypothetical protein n=1 Tax=Pseudarthrobacter sp. S9 TaxID=3418421 RepID=UPI003CFDA294